MLDDLRYSRPVAPPTGIPVGGATGLRYNTPDAHIASVIHYRQQSSGRSSRHTLLPYTPIVDLQHDDRGLAVMIPVPDFAYIIAIAKRLLLLLHAASAARTA